MYKLWFSIARYRALRERLQKENVDLDETTLDDTLEGLTDLHEIVAAIVRSAVADEALAGGLRSLIKDMQARLRRFEERAASRRKIARDVLQEAGLSKITASDLTITVRSGTQGVVVIDPGAIPARFWKQQEPLLMRQELLAELKSGASVDGAQLGNPEPVLSVRVR